MGQKRQIEVDSEDLQKITQALRYWANFIETGEMNLTSGDLQNLKRPAKHLTDDQMRGILELRDLANRLGK